MIAGSDVIEEYRKYSRFQPEMIDWVEYHNPAMGGFIRSLPLPPAALHCGYIVLRGLPSEHRTCPEDVTEEIISLFAQFGASALGIMREHMYTKHPALLESLHLFGEHFHVRKDVVEYVGLTTYAFHTLQQNIVEERRFDPLSYKEVFLVSPEDFPSTWFLYDQLNRAIGRERFDLCKHLSTHIHKGEEW